MRLLEGAQVEFLGPGTWMLPVQIPVVFGNRVDLERAADPALVQRAGEEAAQAIAIDQSVDDDVGDVDALRPEFARHALCQHPQTCLGGGEMGEARLAAQ